MVIFKSGVLGEAVFLMAAGIALGGYPGMAPAQESTRFDANGTVHVPAYTMLQSEFTSEEFKKAYAEHLRRIQTFPHPPAGDATKAEWERFDSDSVRVVDGDALIWDKQHYPVDVVDTKMGGVHVGVVTPKEGIDPKNRNRVLINLRGGGFIMGRGLTSGLIESMPIASIGRMKVVTVDYRQAPDFKFPAASEDVEAVYRELLKVYKPEAIGIYGCSAGGALTGQSVAWFQSKGLPRPGAVGIFCAGPVPFGLRGDSAMWGVLGLPGTSWGTAAPSSAQRMPQGYMQGADINDPRAYPGSSTAVLARFPPTLLISGTRSGDMSAAIVAHARFLKLGVDSYLYIIEGGWHGAYNTGGYATPEGIDTVQYIARWFQQHLAR